MLRSNSGVEQGSFQEGANGCSPEILCMYIVLHCLGHQYSWILLRIELLASLQDFWKGIILQDWIIEGVCNCSRPNRILEMVLAASSDPAICSENGSFHNFMTWQISACIWTTIILSPITQDGLLTKPALDWLNWSIDMDTTDLSWLFLSWVLHFGVIPCYTASPNVFNHSGHCPCVHKILVSTGCSPSEFWLAGSWAEFGSVFFAPLVEILAENTECWSVCTIVSVCC